ncbi:MAG: N-acetylmuramoyl-L-alanine amidase [Terriglobales bacterium]
MSANATRVDWETPSTADSGSSLQEGNRVLESIARQEALRALLAFSELREQIRNRRTATGGASDRDLFETERFILTEVLQLICDRAQVLTQADGIVVALAAKSTESIEKPEMVCRASAGALGVERGVRLAGESAFLQECLESGRILRSDDCESDVRVELDLARSLGARSTVLVPLRGRHERLGVLQAFSTTGLAFTDHDVRCFDLFGELVLSALRPEDQDRRIHWLSDVAGEVLRANPVADKEQLSPAAKADPVDAAVTAAVNHCATQNQELTAAATAILNPSREQAAVTGVDLSDNQSQEQTATTAVHFWASYEQEQNLISQKTAEPAGLLPDDGRDERRALPSADEEAERLAWPVAIPAGTIELPEESAADETFEIPLSSEEPARSSKWRRNFSFPHQLALPGSSRPGLNVVMGLVAVAALFSAGAWWGMQGHGKTVVTKFAAAPGDAARIETIKTSPRSVTTPAAPPDDVLAPAVADNLMNPEKLASDAAPLMAVPEDKLAALPKITGVRHWTSSMGSTVVIDMEDQVPYEVHRLMSPERIYFDLHDTALSAGLDGKAMDVGDASLTRVRVAQPVAGVTRVVLDTRDGSNFSVSMESNPYRLVVELRGSEETSVASHFAPHRGAAIASASLDTAAAPSKAAPVASLTAKASEQVVPVKTFPARTGKIRIVLDAGHGGWDLGTVGREGLVEKDLVLDVTQRLGKLLQARLGAEVMFTRTDDTYLPLEQRADIANQAQADLFVSVHANYSSSATARGVETYYTNLFSAPGSREVERREDGTFAKLTPVSLTAGGLHEKIEESRRLAASVQRALYATLSATSPDIRNRGIKDSAFAVLTGTTMPAILTEISFVSSPADERNLQSETYRQQIAEAIYQGIARYQQSAPRARVAQLQTTAARR